MLIHFNFPTFAVGFQRQQQTISLKVFLSLLEHLLSKSGGDCTFIHQFIECQSEYRAFFTLILMKSGAKLKSERENEDLSFSVLVEVDKGPSSEKSKPSHTASLSLV